MFTIHRPWTNSLSPIRFVASDATEGGTNEPDPAEPPREGDAGDDERLGENGLKALRAERENVKQLKAQLAEANGRIKEFEDRDKSESDKQAEKLADTQKRLDAATLKATQYEIAAAKGIPLTAAARLRGASREEMEADADDLLKLINAGKPGSGTLNPNPPKDDPSQGRGGEPKPHSLREAIANHYSSK